MIRWLIGGVVLATIAIAILMLAVRLIASSATDITDLDEGDCFDLDLDDLVDSGGDMADIDLVDVVACDQPHNAEVVEAGDLNPDHDRPFPSADELFAEVSPACDRLGTDERFGIVPVIPTEATWLAREGRYLCVAVAYGGESITGNHAATSG